MSRWNLLGRLLSLIIGIGYCVVIVTYAMAHSKSAAQASITAGEWCLIAFIPVALIWFPEQIGSATGFIGHSYVNADTPPMLVAIMGWLLLVGLPAVIFLIDR